MSTIDGGNHWSETPVKEAGLSLFFLDDSTGWMVTEKGVWQTAESGRSWTKLKSAPSGLLRIWFLDKKHGFAAGLEKRVFETTSGGETWTLLPIAKEAQGDPDPTRRSGKSRLPGTKASFQDGTFRRGPGGPDWMEPEKAAKQASGFPTLPFCSRQSMGGKTWPQGLRPRYSVRSRASSMAPQGTALGLVEYKDQFDYPSEVFRINTLLHGKMTAVPFKAEEGDYRRACVCRFEPGSSSPVTKQPGHYLPQPHTRKVEGFDQRRPGDLA